MRYLLLTVFACMICAVSAEAKCLICDNEVRMNDEMKECFLNSADTYRKQVSGDDDFIKLDFSTCKSLERGLMSLPVISDGDRGGSYILDKTSFECLYGLVVHSGKRFDPYVTFQLDRDCK